MTLLRSMDDVLQPNTDQAWSFSAENYDPLRETSVEARFTISNGFLGVRGYRSTTRGERWMAPARTYVAGLFDTPSTPGVTRELVPAADWLKVRIMLPDGPLLLHPGEVSSHRMTLDTRKGALFSEGHYKKADTLNVRARTMRLVSLSERSIGLQIIEMHMDDGDIDVRLEALFEGVDLGLVGERIEPGLGLWRTQNSGKRLAIATAASLQIDGKELLPTSSSPLGLVWSWRTKPGQIINFERFVSIVRSDDLLRDPTLEARKKLSDAEKIGWRGVIAGHESAWLDRWRYSDIEVEGDADAQRGLRFALYHLNSAPNPADEHVSIGARALTGDDYHGHVFWDTEIFLLPFYTFTWPEAALTLLMYRFGTLEAARAKAKKMGWRGALYAWESADTGEEMTPEHGIGPDQKIVDILCGKQEQHISADVAFAVWQYWQATGDENFLLEAGAEIVLETGRFWASRADLEEDGVYHIRGVIGPDEYHEYIGDNAFTNVMARWNIQCALKVAALLTQRWPGRWTTLARKIGIDDAELESWANTAKTLVSGLSKDTGLFEQFAGYFSLEDIDLQSYKGRSVPMDVILGRERIQKSQIIKQADVVALMVLLPNEFTLGSAAANFDYYEPRCSQGSSLSRAMYGVAAARLGRADVALRYLHETSAIDLADTHVAIDGGIHIAALGGVWMIVVLGFAGVSLLEDGIAIDPILPTAWRSLTFPMQWRGRQLKIRMDQNTQSIEATLIAGEAMNISTRGQVHRLCSGRPLSIGGKIGQSQLS